MIDPTTGPRQRRTLVIALGILIGLGVANGRAQNLAQFDDWKEAARVRSAKKACGDLRSLTNYNYSVDSATLMPAQRDLPEFCLVQGQILPEVRFEVSLPANWNGRFYMFGNGGWAGEPFTTPVRIRRRDAALKRGFAVAATNTGHDNAREPNGRFALNPQKLIDFGYRAVHVTAVTAKEILRSYYEAAPARSYFDGCSTGGRQALTSAQRFPEDFDGIVAGAPALNLAGVYAHRTKIFRALAAAPRLGEKIALIAERVYAKCDAVDGLADGQIEDPRRCPFNPATDLPRCATEANEGACLTAAEIHALETIYGDVSSNGAKVFPGFPVGAEALVPTASGLRSGWARLLIPPEPLGSLRYIENAFKYVVSPGTELDWREFEVERDFENLRTSMLTTLATDVDLSRFRSRGGKLIMYFGWADPQLNPLMGVDYYEQVRETMATTSEFFRLFMMPGMFHCGGGVGPNLADTITPLVNWVERGIPPDRILATLRREGEPVRTRPLCPYPQVAKYKGSGNIDDAGNFVCSNP